MVALSIAVGACPVSRGNQPVVWRRADVEESLNGWVLIQVVREAIMISSSNLIPRNLQKLPCLFMVLICLKACNAWVRGTIESNLEFQSVFGEKQGW